jgi:hypothetical protein
MSLHSKKRFLLLNIWSLSACDKYEVKMDLHLFNFNYMNIDLGYRNILMGDDVNMIRRKEFYLHTSSIWFKIEELNLHPQPREQFISHHQTHPTSLYMWFHFHQLLFFFNEGLLNTSDGARFFYVICQCRIPILVTNKETIF